MGETTPIVSLASSSSSPHSFQSNYHELSVLFKQAKYILTIGPLSLLFLVPGKLFPQISDWFVLFHVVFCPNLRKYSQRPILINQSKTTPDIHYSQCYPQAVFIFSALITNGPAIYLYCLYLAVKAENLPLLRFCIRRDQNSTYQIISDQ